MRKVDCMPRHSVLHAMACAKFRKLAVVWMPQHVMEHAMACEIEENWQC